MAGGKKGEKSSKRRERKENSEENIVFHDCDSDDESIKTKSESQRDLTVIAENLEDPGAFHKELQEIVSTTQQLLYKFDSKYKPPIQRYRKRSHRKTTNMSDGERSVRSSKSVLLEIHLQLPVGANNIMYHQVSTHNENTYQVLPLPSTVPNLKIEQVDEKSTENSEKKPFICDEQQQQNCSAGDHKNILKTASQISISDKTIYLTPKTSASCFSILTSSQGDIQLLHSQSKLLTLQTPKTKISSPSIQRSKPQVCKQKQSQVDFKKSTSMIGRASSTIRGAGANILYQGKRFMSSISNYMGGYIDEQERKPHKVERKISLSPKVSRTRERRARRRVQRKVSNSKQFSTMPQFSLPPEFSAMVMNGQTMPAILMFMPPTLHSTNSQQQQPLSIPAFCIPFDTKAEQTEEALPSTTIQLNTDCSSATKVKPLADTTDSVVQQLDVNQEASQASCTSLKTDKTVVYTNSDFSCECQNELKDQCIIVTQLDECIEEESIEDELDCCCCASEATLVASKSSEEILPVIPEVEEPPEVCCARNKGESCVECENITAEELETKPLTKEFSKFAKPCSCGLKYQKIPNAKVECTCNADGHLNEDCKLPVCVEKYGVCPCDCDNKESIVKCCKEAFQETCICADYNVPKFYKLALPQHKDLNLCIKCRFDPSPLIDPEGNVFCPGDCGCCLCPWQTRPSLSKDNLMLHEKVRVCVCRDRGTIFNLSPKNSKCNNPGNFDLCPCRERAEAKFLELYEKEMFKIEARELHQLCGPPVTLKDVREVIPLKEKQKLLLRKKK